MCLLKHNLKLIKSYRITDEWRLGFTYRYDYKCDKCGEEFISTTRDVNEDGNVQGLISFTVTGLLCLLLGLILFVSLTAYLLTILLINIGI